MIPLYVAMALSRAEQIAPGSRVAVDEEPGPQWHITVTNVRAEHAPALKSAGFSPAYSDFNRESPKYSLAAHYAGAGVWHMRLTG